jgi:hypothetical protein
MHYVSILFYFFIYFTYLSTNLVYLGAQDGLAFKSLRLLIIQIYLSFIN